MCMLKSGVYGAVSLADMTLQIFAWQPEMRTRHLSHYCQHACMPDMQSASSGGAH